MTNTVEVVAGTNVELGKELTDLQSTLGITSDELSAKLDAILKEPYLASFSGDERLIHGVKVLRAQCAALLMSDATPYTVKVLSVRQSKTIQRAQKGPMTIGGFTGFGYPIGQPEKLGMVEFAAFDEVSKRISGLHPGKTYEVRGSVDEDAVINPTSPIYSLTGDETFKPVEWTGDFASPPNVPDFVRKFYPFFAIKDVEQNLSKVDPATKKVDYSDKKAVQAQIVYATIRSGKDGQYGQYELIDSSLTNAEIKKRGGGLRINVEPADVRFAPGTEVIIVGTVTRREKDGKVYLGMRGDLVIPASNFAIPFTPTTPISASPSVQGAAANVKPEAGLDLSDFN